MTSPAGSSSNTPDARLSRVQNTDTAGTDMAANVTETPEYVRQAVAQHLPNRAASPFVTVTGFQSVHVLDNFPTFQVVGVVNLGKPATGTGKQYITFWFVLPGDDKGTPWAPGPGVYPEKSIIFMSPALMYLFSSGGGPEISTWQIDKFLTITGTGADQNNVLVIGSCFTYATAQPETDVFILSMAFNATITVGLT